MNVYHSFEFEYNLTDNYTLTLDIVSNTTESNVDSEIVVNNVNEELGKDVTVHMLRHSIPLTVSFVIAYFLLFCIGIIGNCMVVGVFAARPSMRTVTNTFIVNLAMADHCVIIFCLAPTLIANIFVPWILGSTMCKMVAFVQGVSVCASVYSLVAIAVDRFLAIRAPTAVRSGIPRGKALVVIILIWILSCFVYLPWLFVFQVVRSEEDGLDYCVETWDTNSVGKWYFLVANLLICYFLPLLSITICYLFIWERVHRRNLPAELATSKQIERLHQRTKTGVLRMLSVMILLFLLSWLPLYIISFRLKFGQPLSSEDTLISAAMPVAQWLGASNSCVNPVLYAFLNRTFQKAFMSILTRNSPSTTNNANRDTCTLSPYPPHRRSFCSSANGQVRLYHNQEMNLDLRRQGTVSSCLRLSPNAVGGHMHTAV